MSYKTYNAELNSSAYTQLNKLTIARLTSGKRLQDATVYTARQLLQVQRLVNSQSPADSKRIAY